ncbi:hypothetical protein HPB50_025384 [Hyalomma asiaticum]|uniref:Uncharacterized protein n=1 Tax=Hyalomma asiaticum TaxID=266040 RepID=A0ACB7TQS9_HYAAI|nr:hypothetical protein HPB50_025384 [Hyalomma asiaticum]
MPFEDEVEKIRLLDDSLQPAELRDSYGVFSKKAKQSTHSTAPSPVSEGGSDSTAEPSGASEDTEESSAETAEKPPKIKTARQSSVRAQEIKLFFEEMERLQRDKEEQKAAREEHRRQRHKERS